jgi:hypothetical protein
MKTTKETNKHKYDTTNKSPPNATCHGKSFDGGRRPETGDIFGELCRKRGRQNKSRGVFGPYSYAAGKVFGISNHCPSERQTI